jgi:type II secretory pathway component PulJ
LPEEGCVVWITVTPTTQRATQAYTQACANIATIRRAVDAVTEDLARHSRCGRCWRARHDLAALDVLLEDLLQAMDARDMAARESVGLQCR